MNSVSSILSKTTSSVSKSDVRQLNQDLKKATASITQDSKYESRSDLQAAGFDRQYDEIQGRLTRVTVYETTVSTSKLKLNAKQVALNDIREAVAKFAGEVVSTSDVAGTKEQRANRALTEIASILNRKEGGKYIFGGKNDNELPVSGDITTLNDQNFTNVTSNENIIDISDTRSVDINMVTARDLASTIKYINSYKSGAVEGALELASQKALKDNEFLQVKVENAINEVKDAESENVTVLTQMREIVASDFTTNIVEKSEAMRNSMYALLTNFKVTMAQQRLQDKLQDGFNM